MYFLNFIEENLRYAVYKSQCFCLTNKEQWPKKKSFFLFYFYIIMLVCFEIILLIFVPSYSRLEPIFSRRQTKNYG